MTDYRDQLQRLTLRQRQTLAEQLGLSSSGRKQLVAYVTGSNQIEAIEQKLAQRLPNHALPDAIVPLVTLPKTPNGKIDRRKLSEPTSITTSPSSPESPKSDIEGQLCTIWAEVLQVPKVGIHEDFYRLGGDSILSIQVVSKAAQAGLKVSMKQFVEHRTIAELAAALEEASHSTPSTLEAFGPVPLTPIQSWFFSCEFEEPQQWNQEILLELPSTATKSDLTKAFGELIRHYDSLRTAFARHGSQWTSTILETTPGDTVSEANSLAEAYQVHSQLELETGKLIKAVLLPDEHQLFIAAHHLAVDHVSWGVLLDGLAALLRGQQLPPVITSFHSWASFVGASRDSWQAEAPFWNRMLQGRGTLPLDGPNPTSIPTEASSEIHRQLLTLDQTNHILSTGSEGDYQIPELLLTGILQSLDELVGEETPWRIGIENHGRHPCGNAPDISQTVGWLTAYHQVTFDQSDLPSVRDRLREVPNHGLGFGILRYLAESSGLTATEDSQILFNYLGHHQNRSAFTLLTVDSGQARSPRNRRSHLLEINGIVREGRLCLHWHYSPAHLQLPTVARLADAFAKTVTRLSRDDQARQFELTSTQKSLLFHHLQQPKQDAGLLHVTFTLKGALDIARFERAWNHIINKHEALRTTIDWQGSEEPRQQVHTESPFRLEKEHDVSACIFLDRLPTMRVSVEKITPDSHRVHWLCHHIFLDGWSASLLCQELLLAYEDTTFVPLDAPRFETYARTLANIPVSESEAYWKAHLLNAPTVDAFSTPKDAPSTCTTHLSAELSKELTTTAEAMGVTVATILQVAWAITMSRIRSTEGAVFGNAVSGRSIPLPDIQNLVGLCANTCPFHLHWTSSTNIRDLVAQCHEAKLQGIPHEHVPLATIQDWLNLAPSQALFESLLMIANYPQATTGNNTLTVTDFDGAITSIYPMTLVVEPGESFALKWFCQSDWLPRLSWFQECFEVCLHGCLGDTGLQVTRLTDSLPHPPALDSSGVPPTPSVSHDRVNDRTEDFIASVWKELFMLDDVDRDVSFRTLGGSSLMAAKLTTKIGDTFQARLPLDFVFKYPTVTAMASAMRSGENSMTWPIVVPIRKEGSQPPLFVIHGLGGGVYDFFKWKDYLPIEQPIYGLQAPITPLDNLEAIASSYITEIRKVQSCGPYHFSSFCFGAAVGFEMAYQLEQQGETIAYFNVIDSILPSQKPSRGHYLCSILWQSRLKDLWHRFGSLLRRSVRLITKGILAAPGATELGEYPPAYLATAQAHSRAMEAYKPKGQLAGNIHLIRSQSQLSRVDPTLGWESLCQHLTVSEIACEHHEIFYSNHTAQITALLNEALMAR